MIDRISTHPSVLSSRTAPAYTSSTEKTNAVIIQLCASSLVEFHSFFVLLTEDSQNLVWGRDDKPVLAGLSKAHSSLTDTTRSRRVRRTTHPSTHKLTTHKLTTHKLTTHSSQDSDECALTQNPELHRLASSTARNTPHPISLRAHRMV